MAKKKPYNPLAPGIVPLTPAQKAYVNSQTTAALAPERAAIQAAQRAAQRSALEQQNRIKGFAQAAAAQLTGALPQTAEAYQQAIKTQQGLGQGLAGAFQGVPGVDQGAVNAQTVLGNIPASEYATNALSQYHLASTQPATELGLGQVGLRSSAAQAQEQQKQYLDQLVQLAAKAPGIRAQIVQQLQQNELQKRAERANEFALGLRQQSMNADIAYKQASIDARKMSYDLQYKKYLLQKKKLGQTPTQKPSEWLSKSNGYLTATDGTPMLSAKGKTIPIKAAAGTTDMKAASQDALDLRGKPLATPYSVVQAQTDAGYQVGKYLAAPGAKGVYSSPNDNGVFIKTTNDPTKARYDTTMTLKQAQTYLVTTYHLTPRQARKVLAGAGWLPSKPKKP